VKNICNALRVNCVTGYPHSGMLCQCAC